MYMSVLSSSKVDTLASCVKLSALSLSERRFLTSIVGLRGSDGQCRIRLSEKRVLPPSYCSVRYWVPDGQSRKEIRGNKK